MSQQRLSRGRTAGALAKQAARAGLLTRGRKPGLLHLDRWEALLDQLDELSAQVAIATREHDTVPLEVAKKEVLGE